MTKRKQVLVVLGYQSQDDDVSGGMDYYGLVEPSTQVSSGESVNLEWHNSSLVGTTVSNMSEADIEMQLDGMGMGEGEHMLSVSVSVNTGGGPLCGSVPTTAKKSPTSSNWFRLNTQSPQLSD